jgi:hypothetical protein
MRSRGGNKAADTAIDQIVKLQRIKQRGSRGNIVGEATDHLCGSSERMPHRRDGTGAVLRRRRDEQRAINQSTQLVAELQNIKA